MNVKYSFVCDAANIAQSGNLNVLGIFKSINAVQFPCVYPRFMYIAHIEFHRSETGKHKFKLNFINDDGKEILPPMYGEINVNPQNPFTNIMVNINGATFPKPGAYQIDLNIDYQHLCTETIIVSDASQARQ